MKTQKKFGLLLTVGIILIALGAKAQGKFGSDSVKCWESTQIYYQLYKSKQYASAFDSWQYVYENCPGAYKNTFIFAPAILESKMAKVEDVAEKARLEEMLLMSYDKRLEIFPGKEGYVYGQKGLKLLTYRKEEPQKAYDALMTAYESDGYDLPAAVFNGMFIAAVRLFNDKIFTIEDVFNTYNIVSEAIEKNNNNLNRDLQGYRAKVENGEMLSDKEQKDTAKLGRELARYDIVDLNVEKTLGPIVSCDRLNLMYNDETFEENKDNPDWLRRASKMLQKERRDDEGELNDCTDLPIFFRVAEASYKLDPNAISARAVGKLAISRKDYSKATEYFTQAGSLEMDPRKKAYDYLKVAYTQQKIGKLSASKASCLKAASLKKGWGDPYILMAQLYASAEGTWGANVVEKKAVFWAAMDKLNYAKSIDPEVAKKCNKLYSIYKQNLPDKTIAFRLSVKDGDKINIGSWINETVVVKF